MKSDFYQLKEEYIQKKKEMEEFLSSLPLELLINIGEYFSEGDLLRFRCCNKTFFHIFSNNLLWKSKSRKKFKRRSRGTIEVKKEEEGPFWGRKEPIFSFFKELKRRKEKLDLISFCEKRKTQLDILSKHKVGNLKLILVGYPHSGKSTIVEQILRGVFKTRYEQTTCLTRLKVQTRLSFIHSPKQHTLFLHINEVPDLLLHQLFHFSLQNLNNTNNTNDENNTNNRNNRNNTNNTNNSPQVFSSLFIQEQVEEENLKIDEKSHLIDSKEGMKVAFLFVFSLSNESSFKRIKQILKQISKQENNQHAQFILVANKKDLQQTVATQEIEESAVQYDAFLTFLSCREHAEVTLLLEAIFSSLHLSSFSSQLPPLSSHTPKLCCCNLF